VNNWLNVIQKKLLPPRCIFCGQQGFADMDICSDCFADLPRNTHCCYRCGENFATAILSPQLCGRCLKNSPHFDDTHAPYLYQDTIRYLITQLKFGQQYKNARLLGNLLAEHLSKTAEKPECIIPMPLHRNRYRQRGFNQSIEIAGHIAKQLQIPIDFYSCIRNRDTTQQSNLPAKQRLKNIRHAFTLTKPLNLKHVAIVDDVLTTGATASALALAIKQSGVSRVDVWVCARA
jgi:ComF family protein